MLAAVAPLVSICIPTYNGAEHLDQCLESALGQSLTDLEIVVVDDASTDATRDVVARHAQGEPRLHLHHNHTRLGLAGNWNRCVELAQGQWIKFLFQDDVLEPDACERLLQAGGPHRPLVAGKRRVVIESGVDEDTRKYFSNLPSLEGLFPNQDFVPADPFCTALVQHLAVNFIGEPSAVLLHRSVFERFGDFNPLMIQLPDLELWARIGVHTGLVLVNETVATFRIHTRSASAQNLRAQKFRKDILDPLILYHQYGYGPGFAPLRRAAAAMTPPVSFAKVTAVEAERARHLANQAARDGDASLLSAFGEVARQNPRLRRSLRLWWLRLRRGFGA